MAERDVRKLNRNELLELVYEYQQNEKKLLAKIDALCDELESRRIQTDECGSIAEAALKLNGVFEAAQRAADQYVESVRLEQEAKRSEIAKNAEDEAKVIIDDAIRHSNAIIKRAEEQATRLNKAFEDALMQFNREKPKI